MLPARCVTRRPGRPGDDPTLRRAGLAALLLGVLLVVVEAGHVTAAPPNTLSNGSVSPGSGLTTTTFVFSVVYASTSSAPAASVVALVANKSVPLALVSGTNDNGTFRGSAKLPAGSWPVVFQAAVTKRNNPVPLTGPTVVVSAPTPPPTPTPRVTLTPGPTPTATPIASTTPQPSSPASGQTGSGVPSLTGQPSATQPGGGTGSASAIATVLTGGGIVPGSTDGDLGTFLTGGLVAIGLLAVVGFTAIWHDRRREQEARRPVVALAGEPAASLKPPGPRSAWERDYAMQDEPIGTVDDDEPTAPEAANEDPS